LMAVLGIHLLCNVLHIEWEHVTFGLRNPIRNLSSDDASLKEVV
jgi:hypothetical protein